MVSLAQMALKCMALEERGGDGQEELGSSCNEESEQIYLRASRVYPSKTEMTETSKVEIVPSNTTHLN